MTMKDVGEELGVSVGTVMVALHQAGVQVRRGGFASHGDEGRTLLDDLYGDPRIVKVLTRHGVLVPEEWSPAGPFESLAPLPLPRGLVRELYESVGLPILHMSLLLGVGQGAVRSGLKAAGVDLRPKQGRTLDDTASRRLKAPESDTKPQLPGNTRVGGRSFQPWGNRTLSNLRSSPMVAQHCPVADGPSRVGELPSGAHE
jgi:hypothetical protein